MDVTLGTLCPNSPFLSIQFYRKRSQLSDWAADNLSPAQIKYAATDAWVSREIHARALAALPTEGAASRSSAMD
jgi:ribonuclease D